MNPLYHEEPPTKICAMCGNPKPLTNFHKMKSSSDGLRPSCKDCRRERFANPLPIVQQTLFVLDKVCGKCNKPKGIEEFNKMTKSKDGYHPYCKQCQSDYNHTHRIEHLNEYKARAHDKNIRPEYKALRREKHRERCLSDRNYPEIRRRHRQRYYQTHKEQAKQNLQRRKQRLTKLGRHGVDYNRILERDGYFCYICQKPIDPSIQGKKPASLAFDHVIPIHPRDSEPQGTHTEENIKPAHTACNARKRNKPFESLTPFDRRGVQ